MKDQDILPFLKEEILHSTFCTLHFSDNYLLQVITAMKERVSFVKEFITNCQYFYTAPLEYEQKSIEKNWNAETPTHLKKIRGAFANLNDPTKENFEQALTTVAAELNIGKGKLIHPLRLAISGISTGPGVFDIVTILGKDEVIKRIDTALEKIK